MGPRGGRLGAGSGLCLWQGGPPVVAWVGGVHVAGPGRHPCPCSVATLPVACGDRCGVARGKAEDIHRRVICPESYLLLPRGGGTLCPPTRVLSDGLVPRRPGCSFHGPDPLGVITFLVRTGWTLPSVKLPLWDRLSGTFPWRL